jgi:hypothetical protein
VMFDNSNQYTLRAEIDHGHVYRDQWGYRTDILQPELNGNPLNILDNFTNHEYEVPFCQGEIRDGP